MPEEQKNVLIIDDFGRTGKILVQMLDHLNVSSDSVESPDQAFQMVSENHYRLVIADSRMPKVNGVSLLKQIRKSNPDTKIAVMSTFDSGQTKKIVVADGIDYYLPKPVTLEQLEKLIRDLSL
jgi:DNA-binding response OmpR family regulator